MFITWIIEIYIYLIRIIINHVQLHEFLNNGLLIQLFFPVH